MNIGNKILDIIYPRCCPICQDIVYPAGTAVCRKCVGKIQPISQPRCMKCGKSLYSETEEYCSDCRNYPHMFDQGIGIYPYNDIMRESIEKYKFHGRREYTDFYIWSMIKYGEPYIKRWKPDCIMAIPLHPSRERTRGFNQSAYLAKGIGEAFQIPVHSKMKRIEQGRSQKELSAAQRRQNLKKAFGLAPGYQPPPVVLLVDDVYTTGSTLDAAARILKQAGARKIYFLTLCQGKGL